MTNIYNITHYASSNSIYVLFKGCNFQCKGCFIKDTKWDYHLADDVRKHFQATKDVELLSLSEFETIVKGLNVKQAVLGGEECTVDEELPNVVDLLTSLGIKTLVTTNGHCLNEELIEELEEAGLSGARMSIKACDDSIHRLYTGHTNKSVLKNFRLLSESRIRPIAESTLIPGLVEQNEIERIAEFIASINPTIPYRVDGFLPSYKATWRDPSPEEVIKAAHAAQKYLWCVHYLHCATEHHENKVSSVYP